VDREDKTIVSYIDRIVKPDQLDEVMPKPGAVFISAPEKPGSHKLFGAKKFELMDQKSYFISANRAEFTI